MTFAPLQFLTYLTNMATWDIHKKALYQARC